MTERKTRTTLWALGIAAIGLMVASKAVSQDLNTAYFTKDFKFRHDMNPAFGNDQNYISFPALGNVGVKMQGNFGVGDVLFRNPQTGKYDRTFMHPDVSLSDALAGLNKENEVLADANVTLLSAGFHAFGGYNTIELRGRASAGVSLPYDLFLFAKDLHNADYHFDDISFRAMSFTEIAFGHSHQVNDDLRIGGKMKLLFGLGRATLDVKDMTAKLVGDEWVLKSDDAKAEVSMKGITFKNTTDDTYNDGTIDEHVDLGETEIDGFGLGGFGLGLDLGAEYKVMDGLKVSAAVTDLGFIKWSNNHLLRQKYGTFYFDGFHDIKVKENGGVSISDQWDDYEDQLSDFIHLDNKGDQGSTTSTLAATVNIGAEYQLPSYSQLSFGLLGTHRFNGRFSWTEGRVSANWCPLEWLDGGLSFALNQYCASTGWVLNIHPGACNFFIGMDHIFGKQTKEMIPLSSNAHIALGVNIAWGKK